MQGKYNELERKYAIAVAANAGGNAADGLVAQDSDTFVSKLLNTVANLFDKEDYSDIVLRLADGKNLKGTSWAHGGCFERMTMMRMTVDQVFNTCASAYTYKKTCIFIHITLGIRTQIHFGGAFERVGRWRLGIGIDGGLVGLFHRRRFHARSMGLYRRLENPRNSRGRRWVHAGPYEGCLLLQIVR